MIVIFFFLNLNDVFNNLNLGSEYSKIYTCLLEEGMLRVIDIAKHTDLPRTSCYEYLPTLMKLGLVEERQVGKSRFFKATSPDHLIQLVYKKKNEVNYILSSLESKYSELTAIFNKNESAFKVKFFNGERELKELFKIIQRENELYAIGVLKESSKVKDGLFNDAKKLIERTNFVNLEKMSDSSTDGLKLEPNFFRIVNSKIIVLVNLEKNSGILIKEEGFVSNELLIVKKLWALLNN
ncbi:helix-turn-helix domain-containing protein [Candidatus Dojkabacteria bacterium]|nr:helix-turn-helix domain-containing protein [Candidatus Dojkabacteria bacterium]